MREIKFRLIRNDKIVGYCNFLHWRPKYMKDFEWSYKPIVHDKKEIITGLKDKNGKEIYEGDIIKYSCPDVIEPEKMNTEIIKDLFEWLQEYGIGISEYGDYKIIEVIGNIHENPELLKRNSCTDTVRDT